ncbi:MAG: LuxR C-terminal-related transcriptional regulator [Armatimonadota bacterium]
MSKNQIRIALALAQPLLQLGVKTALQAEPDFAVVSSVSSPDEVDRAVADSKPRVLVIDAKFRRGDGGDLLLRLAERHPNCASLVMVDHSDEECTVRRLLSSQEGPPLTADAVAQLKECCLVAFQSSARGCIAKSAPPERLVEAVRTVAAGGLWAGPGLSAYFIASVRRGLSAPTQTTQLTPREMDVICLVADGLSNRQIAGRLGLSEQTVKNHLSRILDKLGLESRVELALYAVRSKLA